MYMHDCASRIMTLLDGAVNRAKKFVRVRPKSKKQLNGRRKKNKDFFEVQNYKLFSD